MKITMLLMVMACALAPMYSYGEKPEFVKHLKCQVSKCKVKCLSDEKEWVVLGLAEAVTVSILRNGVTYFQMDMGVDGEQTMIVGKDKLFCKVEDQK